MQCRTVSGDPWLSYFVIGQLRSGVFVNKQQHKLCYILEATFSVYTIHFATVVKLFPAGSTCCKSGGSWHNCFVLNIFELEKSRWMQFRRWFAEVRWTFLQPFHINYLSKGIKIAICWIHFTFIASAFIWWQVEALNTLYYSIPLQVEFFFCPFSFLSVGDSSSLLSVKNFDGSFRYVWYLGNLISNSSNSNLTVYMIE